MSEWRDAAAADIVDIVTTLYGSPPNRRYRGDQVRWGRKGSISVNHRTGQFFSFEEGRGGGVIEAVQIVGGMSYEAAVEWLKQWVGDDYARPVITKPRTKPDNDAETRDRQLKIEQAKSMWTGSDPISGSPAETYLVGRGIPSGPWPDAVRFMPFKRRFGAVYGPGLIVRATNGVGEIVGVQVVALDKGGKRLLDGDDQKMIKRSLGPVGEGAVRFTGPEDGPLVLAEGPETGLTVWRALQVETWVALGSVSKIDLADVPLARCILVAADDDGHGALRTNLKKRIEEWRAEGRRVEVVYPCDTRRGDKSDMNDLAQREGIEAVRKRFHAVTRRPESRNRMAVTEARDALKSAVSGFFSTVSPDDQPHVHVIKASLGLGKTTEAARQLVDTLGRQGGTGVIAVPTHRLADDLVASIRQIEPSVAIWRGREQEVEGEPMCRDLDAVRLAQDAGVDVQEAVCDDGKLRCPFFDSCPYQAQKKQQARIWLVPHALLFHEKPDTIPTPTWLVIDESFWQQALVRPSVTMDEVRRPDFVRTEGREDHDATADLVALREKLAKALPSTGRITRQAVVEAGLTVEDCEQARKLEYPRRITVDLRPGMSQPERVMTARKAQPNRTIGPLVSIWRAIKEALEGGDEEVGRSETYWHRGDDRSDHQRISVAIRHDIRKGWAAPTLVLDATPEMELIHPFFPTAEMVAEIEVETPHQTITQFPDKSFANSWFRDGEAINEKTALKTWARCLALARRHLGQALVVVPMAVEEVIRRKCHIPEWAYLTHHNATRGVDAWRDVASIIVVGRPMAGPRDAEWRAEALSGKAVQKIAGYYPRGDARLVVASEPQTIETERHPDELVERVRWHICEAEIVQEIGRGRGVNRSDRDPLNVYLLNNVAVGEVDAVEALPELTPDEIMLAEHGVALESNTDAADAGLWSTATSLTRHRQRWRPKRNKSSYYGMVTTSSLGTAIYQRAGAGRKRQRLVYDPRDVREIEVWLRDRLGELVHFEIESIPKVIRFPTRQAPSRAIEVPDHGKLPAPVSQEFRRAYEAAGLRQEEVARMVGLSRPQLANALKGRFGVSTEVASRIRVFISRPPEERQYSLAGVSAGD